MDAYLNSDNKLTYRVLVSTTSHLVTYLPPGDPRGITIGGHTNRNPDKWMCNTIKELERTYLRAWELLPEWRIAEDVLRLRPTFKDIIASSGRRLNWAQSEHHYGGHRVDDPAPPKPAETAASKVKKKARTKLRLEHKIRIMKSVGILDSSGVPTAAVQAER